MINTQQLIPWNAQAIFGWQTVSRQNIELTLM